MLHDANYDVHYENGEPLSAAEMTRHAADGTDTSHMVCKGDGFPSRPARVARGFQRHFGPGRSYRLTAVWRRMDFLTAPQLAAVHHGSIVYHEPEWLWRLPPETDPDEELGMFQYRTFLTGSGDL